MPHLWTLALAVAVLKLVERLLDCGLSTCKSTTFIAIDLSRSIAKIEKKAASGAAGTASKSTPINAGSGRKAVEDVVEAVVVVEAWMAGSSRRHGDIQLLRDPKIDTTWHPIIDTTGLLVLLVGLHELDADFSVSWQVS